MGATRRLYLHLVIPAKAGIHASAASALDEWTPAFAGVTVCKRCGRNVINEGRKSKSSGQQLS
jgi:hypothetical protein